MDDLVAALPRLGLEVLPISAFGWLGVRLLASSVGQAERSVKLGGPYAFLVVWGFAIFVNFKTVGRASSIISILYILLLALGLLACVVRLVVGAFARPSKRQ